MEMLLLKCGVLNLLLQITVIIDVVWDWELRYRVGYQVEQLLVLEPFSFSL